MTTPAYKKSKIKCQPHYLRMLVDCHDGNMASAARELGLTSSTVSTALKKDICSKVIELAAQGLVDRKTSGKDLEEPPAPKNPRATLRDYYRGKTVHELSMDDLKLMTMTVVDIIKTPQA